MSEIRAKIDWSRVQQAVTAAERDGAVLGVAIAAPNGERFAHNGARRFVAASTVKVPLMITLFREIDAGRRSLAEPYVLRAADRASGSGVMLHLHEGMEFTLGDLVYLMISISDNTATNILIDLLGIAAVNATMRDLGMTSSTLARKMRGRAATGDEPENSATPEDYALVIAALLGNAAASPASCAEMIAFLEKQQNDRRIARHLPKTDRPRWGSKTGSVPGVVNDVGFIEVSGGAVVLSIFAEGLDPHRGEAAIGDISSAAWQAIQ